VNHHVYTLADFGGDVIQVVGEYLEDEYGYDVDDELLIEHCAMNCEIIDYDDESPVLGVDVDGDVYGYVTPTAVEDGESASGECYGAQEPPEPDIYAHKYDL